MTPAIRMLLCVTAVSAVSVAAATQSTATRLAPTRVAPSPQAASIGRGHAPHPITAEHLRLYRDVDLLDAAKRAILARRFERARTLLQQHHDAYPQRAGDDAHALRVLLDCVERPSTDTRDAARRFYEKETHSMLRRKIRRTCLEQAQLPPSPSVSSTEAS